jgi:DNA-directed RNA polymerase subunit RPC12/RpoP
MTNRTKITVSAVLIVAAGAIVLWNQCPAGCHATSEERYVCEGCGHQFAPDWTALRAKFPDLPPKVQVEESNLPIPCPQCGQPRARAAIRCPKCGAYFLTLKDGRFCPHCGREL